MNKHLYLCHLLVLSSPTYILAILGAFAKSRKAITSFVMSVPLSVRLSLRTEQLDSHWTDFHEIQYLMIFRKCVEKIQVSLKSEKNVGYFT